MENNDLSCTLLEGHLKEKRNSGTGRWRFFKRWQTKYFTLNTAVLTSSKTNTLTSVSVYFVYFIKHIFF